MLRVIAPAGAGWPGVVIKATQGKWDISAYDYISVDIHNVDTHDIDVYVRVDSPGENNKPNSITERIGAQPDQRVTLTIPLKRVSNSPIKLSGMNGYPQGLYPDKVGLDCSKIVASVPFTGNPETECGYCHSERDVKFPGGLEGPMLIGEFHFGAGDRGLFWNGLVSAENQTDRGARYAGYVESALDNSQIIGVHWFQYGDEATTGRGDGENAQCGFVDVCDTPYTETIRASREVAESMYDRRAKGQAD